jgi:hypothetical protein
MFSSAEVLLSQCAIRTYFDIRNLSYASRKKKSELCNRIFEVQPLVILAHYDGPQRFGNEFVNPGSEFAPPGGQHN